MNVDEMIRTISLIVAPAVMISCCLIFLNGLLQRYEGIGSLMRVMNQERFGILRVLKDVTSSDTGRLEQVEKLRVSEIEAQLPHLLNRYKLIHDASLTLGLAVLLYVTCMFIIALATILRSNLLSAAALLTFLLGMVTVFIGGVIVMLEIYKSHLSVRYEVLHSLSFGESNPTLTLPRVAVPYASFWQKDSSIGLKER